MTTARKQYHILVADDLKDLSYRLASYAEHFEGAELLRCYAAVRRDEVKEFKGTVRKRLPPLQGLEHDNS